ncbi:MAG: septal ring lytic transglycosylase RlpA family protein, partial [Betaproteobacteria bacterium]|nr:septal ring lytic transglycosylase RlpA family protein [Betaproteobacteria bacterium]
MKRQLPALVITLLLAACGGQAPVRDTTGDGTKGPASKPTPTKKPTAVLKRGGGFYKDDGPADEIPDGLDDIPDAEPKWEPLHKPATKPYVVLGKEYVPNTAVKPYKVRGIASWYGKKFHGQKTSIGEPYDMFAMTAAHPTLALPSYVRVTSLQSGKSVIVRITDRGPFHADRVIDLSYTAAYKLGLINGGSGLVEVEAIIPGEATTTTYAQVTPPAPRPAAGENDDIAQLAQRMAMEEKPVQTTIVGTSSDVEIPKGVYLQLGAFSSAENAESLKNHLLRELDWVSEAMR